VITVARVAKPKVSWHQAVVVITGGSEGIGRAVAEHAVARGARVGLVARHRHELDAALEALGGERVGAVAVADVADRRRLEAALAALGEQLGPVDILVNNAGIGAAGAVAAVPVESIERVMAVNYLGTVYATKAVLPGMLARRRGHIVNMASVGGRFAAPGEAAYSATKFAVIGFSQALALEVWRAGVGVSVVDPGPVDTGFYDNRGADYQRRWPRKVPAARVARAVIGAVERARLEVVVPPWYRGAGLAQAAFAGALRAVPTSVFGIVPDAEFEVAPRARPDAEGHAERTVPPHEGPPSEGDR
jgi:short-subunit dehydrogenase